MFTEMERKRQEQEHETYREMVRNANSAIIRWKRDGTISFFNDFAQKLFGYTSEEIIGKHVTILVPEIESSGANLTPLVQDIVNHPELYVNNTNENVCRDGHRIWMTWTNKALFDETGKVAEILAVGSDITKLKQVESEREKLLNEVRKEKEKLSALVNSIQDEIWFADMNKHFTLANPAALAEFGLGSGGILDVETFAASLSVLRPDGSPRPVEEAPPLRALKGEIIINQEEMIETPARGALRYRQVSSAPVRDGGGNIIGSVSVVRDITEHKRAEEALQVALARAEEGQRTLNALMEHVPMGLIIADAPDVRIRMVSHYGRELTAQPGEQIEDIPMGLHSERWQLYRRDDATRATNEELPLTRAIQEGELVMEEEWVIGRPDGTKIPILCTSAPIRDSLENITGAVFGWQNISERKRMEEELRKSRDELELRVQERTAELKEANERLREENQGRIRTEQSLRLEEARLDALLKLSRMSEVSLKEISNFTLEQAIGLTNSKIGFVGFLNEDESIYTLHAVSKDVVKECNVPGDPLQWHVVDAGIWAEAIRERRPLFVNDYSKPHPKKRGLPPGHPYVERIMVVPIPDGERIVAVAGVGNKASEYNKSDERQIALLLSGMWGYLQKNRSREELQNAYNELEKANAELGRSNRQLKALNQELQDFAFVASHDLNEPLRKIRAFGDMIAKRLMGLMDEASKDYLKRMQTAAARMQDLLNSLLSYSRVTTKADRMRKTDLRKSIEEALSNLEILMGEKNADVRVGDVPTIEADRVQMTQLFQNLIGNALKFHREGQAPHVKIHAKKVGDAYEIYVEDNGIGFEDKDSDKIFLPFHRLHGRSSEYQGVGMGLAICRKIVERHGGKITARSEPGRGSTFVVTLPKEHVMTKG